MDEIDSIGSTRLEGGSGGIITELTELAAVMLVVQSQLYCCDLFVQCKLSHRSGRHCVIINQNKMTSE